MGSLEAMDEFEEELTDRFGNYPPPVQILLDSVRLKITAAEKGFSTIVETADGFAAEKNGSVKVYRGDLKSLIKNIS